MNEAATKPVELEVEFPKTASAQEWIPLLVKVKRPDCWTSGIAVRNVSTADRSVQVDLAFLDREMIVRPGEQYRFTVPIQVPTQRDLVSDIFRIQIHQENSDQKDDSSIPLPTKKMRVSPSLDKEIKVTFEPICVYDEGTKGVLRIKNLGNAAFEDLTINLLPEHAIWSGKPIVQRRNFLVDAEEKIDLVLKDKEIDVKISVNIEGQRFEKMITIAVGKPAPLCDRTYVFLEPRQHFDGQIEVQEVDSIGSESGEIFSDQNSMWPLRGGMRYQIGIRSKAGGAADSIRIRDIPGMIVVRNGEEDAKTGAWRFIIDVTSNDLLSKSEIMVVSYLRCTAEKLSHSRIDHMWSVKPAAIAGVRACHLPFGPFWRNVRTGQQKL
jgi:hypothetical protein